MGLIKRVNFNNESLCVCDLKGKNDEFWIKRIIILILIEIVVSSMRKFLCSFQPNNTDYLDMFVKIFFTIPLI